MEIVRALLNKYADIDIRGQVGAPVLSFITAGLVRIKQKEEAFLCSPSCFLGKVNFSAWIVSRKTTTGFRLLHMLLQLKNTFSAQHFIWALLKLLMVYFFNPCETLSFSIRMERLPSTGQWRKVTLPW